MALKDYIGTDENIQFVFRMGFEYYFYVLIVILLCLLGIYSVVQGSPLEWGVFAAAIWVILYRTLYYIYTVYFVTETYLYKREGFFRRKLTAVKQKEIENIIISKGALERFLFGAGTIRVNIKGSDKLSEKLVMKRIAAPEVKVQRMKTVWNMD